MVRLRSTLPNPGPRISNPEAADFVKSNHEPTA